MSLVPMTVVVRVRPQKPSDGRDIGNLVVDGNEISASNASRAYDFSFSKCYTAKSTQSEVFDSVRPLLKGLFEGVNATIFAYGVTGSGKTHTMQGSPKDPGIIPRVAQAVFDQQGSSPRPGFRVSFSYVEILKDEVYDLIPGGSGLNKLDLRTNQHGEVLIPHLRVTDLASLEQFEEFYAMASASRTTAFTNLNSSSSRSHAILTLYLQTIDGGGRLQSHGKICLCDLAGSENNKITGNDKERMLESAAINKSLTVLGKVVEAINKKATRIPYRDSKLTRVLQDALGGESLAMLLCCVAPGEKFQTDTVNSLNFAMGAQQVKNKPTLSTKVLKPMPQIDRSSGRIILATAPRGSANLLRPVLSQPQRAGHSNAARKTLLWTGPAKIGLPARSENIRPLLAKPETMSTKEDKVTLVGAALQGRPSEPRPAQATAPAQQAIIPVSASRTDSNTTFNDLPPEEMKMRAKVYLNMAREQHVAGNLRGALENYDKARELQPHNRGIDERITLVKMALEGLIAAPLVSEHTQQAFAAQGGMKRSRGMSSDLAGLSEEGSDEHMKTPQKRVRTEAGR